MLAEGATAEPILNGENGGRGCDGRFQPGNAGGPGRKRGVKVLELGNAFQAEINEEALRRVARKLLDMSLAGDLGAIKLLLDRVLGRPDPTAKILEEGCPSDMQMIGLARAIIEADNQRLAIEERELRERRGKTQGV